MGMTITLGWWLIPTALTVAAWVPTFRYEPTRGGYIPDVAGAILALASLTASFFVWMIYFAIGWALS
jgi:hypothetical protein